MKIRMIAVHSVIAIIGFTAFGFSHMQQNDKTSNTELPDTSFIQTNSDTNYSEIEISELNEFPGNQNLLYLVKGRYIRPITKEKLKQAKLISDVVPNYPVNWITDYSSVEILTTCNGKERKAIGPNESLTPEQKNIFNSVDMAANIFFYVQFKTKNPVTNNIEYGQMDVCLTIIPEANSIWSIMQDKKGILWFGTTDGIYCYDPSDEIRTDSKTFTHFSHNDGVINNTGVPINKVESILEDKNGNIWFGGRMTEGVFRFDPSSGGLTNFKSDYDNRRLWPIFEDRKGNIWFSRLTHSWFYDGKTFTRLTEKERIGVPVFQDKAGNIWFSGGELNGRRGDGGIWRYDGKSYTNFTSKDGLGDYYVWCMVEDKSGNIWIGTTNTDLYRYDPSVELRIGSKSFTKFSE